MCLAVPVRIVSVKGSEAEVEIGDVRRMVSTILTPGVKAGDYVLLHAGYAINVLDVEEAKETLKLFKQMADVNEVH